VEQLRTWYLAPTTLAECSAARRCLDRLAVNDFQVLSRRLSDGGPAA
jgi:hypothetical protein